MITLHSAELALRIDTEHGAEIRSLVRRSDDIELLLQTPWPRVEARAPASDEEWVRRWPGGWQLLTPNAGNACLVGRRRHGFHGDASLLRWNVVEQRDDLLVAAWRDVSGLAFVRQLVIEGPRVIASTDVVNEVEETQQLLLVEHLVFGVPLAGPGVRIDAPASTLVPLDADVAVPIGPAVTWPPSGWSCPSGGGVHALRRVRRAPAPRRPRRERGRGHRGNG
jgi:hypothetical protein